MAMGSRTVHSRDHPHRSVRHVASIVRRLRAASAHPSINAATALKAYMVVAEPINVAAIVYQLTLHRQKKTGEQKLPGFLWLDVPGEMSTVEGPLRGLFNYLGDPFRSLKMRQVGTV